MNPFRSWLGALNFLVLQWFFVRLVDVGIVPWEGAWIHQRYELMTGVVPLTGWWNEYWRIWRHKS